MIFLKKALSFVLAFVLLSSLVMGFAMTAQAAGSKTVSVSGYQTPTANGGLFGKDSDEYAHLASGAAKYSVTMTTTDGDFADKKYFVVDINFAPMAGENTVVNQMSASDNIGNTIHVGKLSNGDYNPNRWNHARMIIEDSNYETMMANGYSQKYTFYLNGKLIGEDKYIKKHDEKYNLQFKGLRVMFGTDDGVTTRKTYLADFVMSESDTKPVPVLPVLTSNNLYTVNSNNTVEFEGELTAKSIYDSVKDSQVKVYKNDTFNVLLTEDDELSYGNIIVLKSEDNIYNYYTVTTSAYGETVLASVTDTASFSANGLTRGNATITAVKGIGSKASDDESMLVKSPAANSDTYIQYTWGKSTMTTTKPSSVYDYDWDKKCGVFTDYLVFEASIYPIDITTANVVTDYGSTVADNFCSSLTPGVWNRVQIVVDRTATTSTNNKTKTKVYVNGTETSSAWKETTTFGDHYTTGGKHKAKNAFRLRLLGGDPANGGAYIDDIRIYEAKALRQIEKASLNASDKYIIDGNKLYIPYGGKVNASELTAESDCSVTSYNSDMTQTVTELSEGCTVAIIGKSSTAKELNLPYNDLYTYYTVVQTREKYELVTSNPNLASNGGTTESISDAVNGNASGEIKKVNISASNNFYNLGWKKPNFGMKYLVCAANVLPTDGITGIFIGTNSHALMSPNLSTETYVKTGIWTNLVFVYDIEANATDVYVNGELAFSEYKTKYVSGTSDCLRFVINGEKDSYCYIDDFYIYESALGVIPASPVKLDSGDVEGMIVNNSASSIKISSTSKVKDVTALFDNGNCTVYADSSCKSVLSADDLFTNGNVVVAKTGEFNAYTVYNVNTYGTNEIVATGDTYDEEKLQMVEGSISFSASVTDGGALIAAQYDKNGVLSKISLNSIEHAGIVTVNFTPDKLTDSKIKVFLFESTTGIKPLCEPLEIDYVNVIDILFLGNSYSMDVSWHLGGIAQADDVPMNVYVLNKGGCSLSYHYDNRFGNAAELGINFWKNDVSLGTIYNLDTALEKFDWDYIVIQNSSTSEGIDDTSESNYQKNWAVAVPFAQYLHEKEPDARIAFHSTWSMEAGYNFVGDIAERDQVHSNMRTNSLRAANEINEALGFEGDEKVLVINSTDILEYARYYEMPKDTTFNGRVCKEGTRIFETTYYKQGHVFDSKEIAVGDGTMLLNDADKTAGKISLHRDGFHMSALGRYLIALNAYKTITGNDVTGNTYAPDSIRLDSSPGGYHVTETDKGTLTGTCYQTYDALSEEIIELCQTLVDESN